MWKLLVPKVDAWNKAPEAQSGPAVPWIVAGLGALLLELAPRAAELGAQSRRARLQTGESMEVCVGHPVPRAKV